MSDHRLAKRQLNTLSDWIEEGVIPWHTTQNGMKKTNAICHERVIVFDCRQSICTLVRIFGG